MNALPAFLYTCNICIPVIFAFNTFSFTEAIQRHSGNGQAQNSPLPPNFLQDQFCNSFKTDDKFITHNVF